ncbi:unnamed protein product [Closterium sp. NIES-64]|nr:unnamed protein product [Closterium sp. NIES-64]
MHRHTRCFCMVRAGNMGGNRIMALVSAFSYALLTNRTLLIPPTPSSSNSSANPSPPPPVCYMCAGVGNRIMALISAFSYSLLTNRTLIIPPDSFLCRFFCEPFPGSSWTIPLDAFKHAPGLHVPSAPLSFACSPHMLSSHALLTCSPHMLSSHALLTCSPHMLSSHALLTCSPHMLSSHALLTCSPHMLSSHALLTCPPHMPSSHALLARFPSFPPNYPRHVVHPITPAPPPPPAPAPYPRRCTGRRHAIEASSMDGMAMTSACTCHGTPAPAHPVHEQHLFLLTPCMHALLACSPHPLIPPTFHFSLIVPLPPLLSPTGSSKADTWGMFCEVEQQAMAAARFATLYTDYFLVPHFYMVPMLQVGCPCCRYSATFVKLMIHFTIFTLPCGDLPCADLPCADLPCVICHVVICHVVICPVVICHVVICPVVICPVVICPVPAAPRQLPVGSHHPPLPRHLAHHSLTVGMQVTEEALLGVRGRSIGALVVSLNPTHGAKLRDRYMLGKPLDGSTVSVFSVSGEGEEKQDDLLQYELAVTEIDVLLVTDTSTFGYVAAGVAGVTPYTMNVAKWKHSDWRSNGRLACMLGSSEPCYVHKVEEQVLPCYVHEVEEQVLVRAWHWGVRLRAREAAAGEIPQTRACHATGVGLTTNLPMLPLPSQHDALEGAQPAHPPASNDPLPAAAAASDSAGGMGAGSATAGQGEREGDGRVSSGKGSRVQGCSGWW